MSMARTRSKNGEAYPLHKLSNYFSSPVNLEKDSRTTGLIGWAALVAFVVGYDIFAIKSKKAETLTRSFWRLSEGKMSKFPVMAAWMIVTFHLMLEKDVRRKITK
jgi:hypothetical protein